MRRPADDNAGPGHPHDGCHRTYDPAGGPAGLGYIQGSKKVDPEEWFFKAHFYQDPVWPGSLGVEAFIQLLKFIAIGQMAPSCL